jgi:hypothetical protein
MFQGVTIANVVGVPEASQMKALFATLIQQLQTYGPGKLNIQSTSVGNGADTTNDTAHTFTLPAGFLTTLGTNAALEIEAWGVSAANGNNKTFVLLFGSTTLISSGVVTINNKSWFVKGRVIRSGTSTQAVLGQAQSDATAIAASSQAVTEDETATIVIKTTVASPTTGAANDLLAKGFIVKVVQ